MIDMLPAWFVRPLVIGDYGDDVVVVERKLGLRPTGAYDDGLAAIVRGYQQALGLPVTGVVDEDTAVQLGDEGGYGLLPDWYKGAELSGLERYLGVVADLLDVTPDRAIDALKRFQGNCGLPATGVVDEWTARKLGQ